MADFLDFDELGEDIDYTEILARMVDTFKKIKSTLGPLTDEEKAKQEEAHNLAKAKYLSLDPAEQKKKDIYLDGTCPPGYLPCDDDVDCDDKYATYPPMYNARGERCYVREGVVKADRQKVLDLVKKAKKQRRYSNDTREMEVSVRLVREFVRLAAQLSSRLNTIGKLEVPCEVVNGMFPPGEANDAGRRAFCETLLNPTGDYKSRKCIIGADKMCATYVPPAAP